MAKQCQSWSLVMGLAKLLLGREVAQPVLGKALAQQVLGKAVAKLVLGREVAQLVLGHEVAEAWLLAGCPETKRELLRGTNEHE